MENTVSVKMLLDGIESEAERRISVNRIVKTEQIPKERSSETTQKSEKDSKQSLTDLIKSIGTLLAKEKLSAD